MHCKSLTIYDFVFHCNFCVNYIHMLYISYIRCLDAILSFCARTQIFFLGFVKIVIEITDEAFTEKDTTVSKQCIAP